MDNGRLILRRFKNDKQDTAHCPSLTIHKLTQLAIKKSILRCQSAPPRHLPQRINGFRKAIAPTIRRRRRKNKETLIDSVYFGFGRLGKTNPISQKWSIVRGAHLFAAL